jgi:hypothetical protein
MSGDEGVTAGLGLWRINRNLSVLGCLECSSSFTLIELASIMCKRFSEFSLQIILWHP